MGTKLFVGGLPFATTDQQLEEMFTKAGSVLSANIITDRNTGRSRGFGFVEMGNDEEAEKAIKELNETEVDDRKIVVAPAKPKENEGNEEAPPQE